ncbi:hypothetical protein BS329_35250 [Amycolatopsis coloradensis]|uniref:Condensation domain-containing protein n=1 Tax=Amycolatopsis coloradensis TaxID=76021 RepID=A0A1R0KH70_9PSEU|nr:condensation domain-containing protein [Amycolatopsis coloradensis]OLZ45010.1 hypothetical protein BS329_35250 [Amycolatopsis coloradensis]
MSRQQEIEWRQELVRRNPVFNMAFARRITGPLDVAALTAALQGIVTRHAALRTSYADVDGRGVQVVAPHVDIVVPQEDLSHVADEAERMKLLDDLVLRDWGALFDLTTAPLLRARLVKLAEADHVLVLVLHHGIADGWSTTVFFPEFAENYTAHLMGTTPDREPLPIQFTDFALHERAWTASEEGQRQAAWWRERLAGLAEPAELPYFRPRDEVDSYEQGSHVLVLSAELVDQVTELGRGHDATLFMTMLAAFQLVLAGDREEADIVVTSSYAGRNRLEYEPVIGNFSNSVVLRGTVRADWSFAELLQEARRVTQDSIAHQEVPHAVVRDLLGWKKPHSEVLFIMQPMLPQGPPAETPDGAPWIAEYQPSVAKTIEQFGDSWDGENLVVDLDNRGAGGLVVTLDYNSLLLDHATVTGLASAFERVLKRAVRAPQAPVRRLRVPPG